MAIGLLEKIIDAKFPLLIGSLFLNFLLFMVIRKLYQDIQELYSHTEKVLREILPLVTRLMDRLK